VTFGSLVRNSSRLAPRTSWASVFLHMARVFYHGAYKSHENSTEVYRHNIVDAHADAVGLRATCSRLGPAVSLGRSPSATNMMGDTPVVRTQVKYVLLGSKEIGSETLLRWVRNGTYLMLPSSSSYHGLAFWRVRKDAASPDPSRFEGRKEQPPMADGPEHLLKRSKEASQGARSSRRGYEEHALLDGPKHRTSEETAPVESRG